MHAVPQIYGVHLPVRYLLCSKGKTLPRFLLPTITPRQRQIPYIPRHCFSKICSPTKKMVQTTKYRNIILEVIILYFLTLRLHK